MTAEQREFTRVRFRATASFDLPDGTSVVGEVSDLSMNGVFVNTRLDVVPGTDGRLVLLFGDQASDGFAVYSDATVIRTTDGGFALRINEVDLDSYRHLSNLVLYNAPVVERVQVEIDSHVGLKRRDG